jgi:hypothetical protein
MSALPILHAWRRRVREDLLPGLHGHQQRALADFSFALARVQHCHSGRLAAAAVGSATPAAARRRLERLLANPRLDPDAAGRSLAAAALAAHVGAPIRLILDETPNRNHLRCLRLTLAYRKRALPLLSRCYAPGRQDGPMPGVVCALLREAAACLPEGAEVTLLADRGLAWPAVVDACTELGWHYVLRLLGPTRVRPPGGPERSAAELASHPGASWRGTAEVYKKSGWRAAAVAACWPAGADGPWLLASDRDDGPRLFARYAGRTWIEESFRDEKSSGFRWGDSRVRDPEHAARLVLLMALAMHLALGLGSRAVRAGLRRLVDTTRRRKLSYFQIGLRLLNYYACRGLDWTGTLAPSPP